MRRRSDKAATKKAKPSPEKKEKEKPEKVKRTRSRRRKQSSSSENEAIEDTVTKPAVALSEPAIEPVLAVANEESPEQTQEQVWHVKAADSSGDGGEIQKLKICLTRPPSTPERIDRSPRSKRKHTRATSSSDTPSNESDDKKKPKHRTRRATAEARDSIDNSVLVQSEEAETENQAEATVRNESNISQSESNITQSNDLTDTKDSTSYDTPMSTTNDDIKEDTTEKAEESDGKDNTLLDNQEMQPKTSDADTTVASPKNQDVAPSSPKDKSPDRKRSPSLDKSEVLELHSEDIQCESSDCNDLQEGKSKDNNLNEKEIESIEDSSKVSINEAEGEVSGTTESSTEVQTSDTKNDVVESGNEDTKIESTSTQETSTTIEENLENKQLKEMDEKQNSSSINEKSCDELEINITQSEQMDQDNQVTDENKDNSEVVKPAEEISNGQTSSLVINRKRRWGSRPAKLSTQKSLTISTDVLKDIIPDVKPTEFEEVIEERKHKRIEITEKIERPVLPKIVIDNSENVERHKKEIDDKDNEEYLVEKKFKDSQSGSSRRISIAKDNDSIITRPPSPPKHKQSNILFITNLVRPFTLPQLKNLLQRTGRIVENGFWIDKIKSKCFVIYENEDQAVETRHALHGVTWPVSNPKTLQVDFSTQEEFDKAKANEDTDNAQAQTIPGTVEDWLREQDMKREKGETEKPWERKAATREWDLGKNDRGKDKEKFLRDERPSEKRRHRSPERSPEPARKFKKKEEEAPAKLLDDLFRKTKTTPCIYWLPLSAETIAVKEEQRRLHMAEYERRMQDSRRPHRRH